MHIEVARTDYRIHQYPAFAKAPPSISESPDSIAVFTTSAQFMRFSLQYWRSIPRAGTGAANGILAKSKPRTLRLSIGMRGLS
jgi:hypothetical protein